MHSRVPCTLCVLLIFATRSRNRNASVLYIDNPVGTGFSYTSDPGGYPNYVNESSDDLFVALQQFYTIWDEYRER